MMGIWISSTAVRLVFDKLFFLAHFPSLLLAEERGPGDFVDLTRARRHEMEDINWPRPR